MIRRKVCVSEIGESPSWLRHRILIPACEGSNPSSPATIRKLLNRRHPFGIVHQLFSFNCNDTVTHGQ